MKYTFAAIFDKDGVITDNNSYHKDAWHIFLKKYNLSLSDEEFAKAVYGRTNEEIIDEIWPQKPDFAERDRLSEEKEAIFREIYAPDFKLTTGLGGFFKRLKEVKIPVAVATNAPLSNLDFTLDKGNLRDIVDVAVYAHQVAAPKPAPDVYLKAMELLKVKPENSVVFEDSLTGIKAGRAAGAKIVAITTTYSKAELLQVADIVIDNFDEISLDQLQELIEA